MNASPANPLHFPAAELLILVREISPGTFAEAFLARRYGLTAAECTCALALAEACSVPALARQLNISTNTVQALLRAIFAKTSTGRQAELVALLARLPQLRPDLNEFATGRSH